MGRAEHCIVGNTQVSTWFIGYTFSENIPLAMCLDKFGGVR